MDNIFGFVVIVTIGFSLFTFGVSVGKATMERTAVEINYAHYDTKTKEFKWNNCEVAK